MGPPLILCVKVPYCGRFGYDHLRAHCRSLRTCEQDDKKHCHYSNMYIAIKDVFIDSLKVAVQARYTTAKLRTVTFGREDIEENMRTRSKHSCRAVDFTTHRSHSPR